jgi:tetratricopeptide (TPR) repeat protein
MHKYLSALILIGMLVSESRSLKAQVLSATPEIVPENRTAPGNQTDGFSDLVNSAKNKIKKGEYQSARLDLNKAIELAPQNPQLFALRGIVYDSLERYERAIQDYNQAIGIDSKDATFYSLRGEAYEKLGRYELAVVNYSQVIQLNPKSSQAYIKRGYAYQVLKDGDKSITDFNQAVALNPQDAEVYHSRGKFYASVFIGSSAQAAFPIQLFYNPIEDAKAKAFKDYDMAIKLSPKKAVYYYNRGILHREIMKSFNSALFRAFDYGSERQLAINDWKIAEKLFMEAGEVKYSKIVRQTIESLP